MTFHSDAFVPERIRDARVREVLRAAAEQAGEIVGTGDLLAATVAHGGPSVVRLLAAILCANGGRASQLTLKAVSNQHSAWIFRKRVALQG